MKVKIDCRTVIAQLEAAGLTDAAQAIRRLQRPAWRRVLDNMLRRIQ